MQQQGTRMLPRSFLRGGMALLLVCLLLVMTAQRSFAAPRVSTQLLLPSTPKPTLYIGDDHSNLYAVNADVGSTRWHVSLNAPIGATPFAGSIANVGNVVYAGTEELPNFFCNDATSGARRFNTTVGSASLLTTPVIFNNKLYFSDAFGIFHAARADNCDSVRSFSVEPDNIDSAALGATIGGRPAVYFGTARQNKVFALDPESFSQIWSTQLPGSPQGAVSTPVADDRLGLLYVCSTDHHIYALSASDGHVVWSYQAAGAVTAAPRISQGLVSQLDKVYFGALNGTGTVYALNANNGAFFWQVDVGESVAASVTVNGSAVYVVDVKGVVRALDNGNKGATMWTFDSRIPADGHTGLLLANGLLYVPVTRPDVHTISIFAIHPDAGTEDWRWDGLTPSALPEFSNGRTLEPLSLLAI